MGTASALNRLGLTNYDSEDIGVLAMAPKKKDISYYCTSVKCCTYLYEKANGNMDKRQYARIEKEPRDYSNNCPDCGAALTVRKLVRR